MENQKIINKSSKQQGSIRRLTVRINPPQESDWECDCCGRPISELEPFSLEWNRESGAFDAIYLGRQYRRMCPYDEEAEKAERIYNEFHWEGETYEDSLKADKKMIEKYGEKKVEEVSFLVQAATSFDKSWECRDCGVLNERDYFEKHSRRFRNE